MFKITTLKWYRSSENISLFLTSPFSFPSLGHRVGRGDPGERAVHGRPRRQRSVHPQSVPRGLPFARVVQVPAPKVRAHRRGRGLERVSVHKDQVQVSIRWKVSTSWFFLQKFNSDICCFWGGGGWLITYLLRAENREWLFEKYSLCVLKAKQKRDRKEARNRYTVCFFGFHQFHFVTWNKSCSWKRYLCSFYFRIYNDIDGIQETHCT